MFTGVVESRSHEGGLLVHFEGSSPALNAILIRLDDATYIGKVDGVLGSTDHPLAHIAHVDRSLNLDELIGLQVTIRKKQVREHPQDEKRGSRQESRRDTRQTEGRYLRGGEHREQRNQRSPRGFESGERRNQHSSNSSDFNNDWTCSECQNSNFARRDVCNRCQAPRPGGAAQRQRSSFQKPAGRDRNFSAARSDRGREQRGPQTPFTNNDWTCPQCQNSNFSFRNSCNRCQATRPGNASQQRQPYRGGGQRDRGSRPSTGGDRGNRGGGQRDHGSHSSPGGDRGNRGGRFSQAGQRGYQAGRPPRGDGQRGRPAGDGSTSPRPSRFGEGESRFEGEGRARNFSRRDGPRNERPVRETGQGKPRPENRGTRSNTTDPSYRKARGKRSGHAHNQPPRDFREPKKFQREYDD